MHRIAGVLTIAFIAAGCGGHNVGGVPPTAQSLQPAQTGQSVARVTSPAAVTVGPQGNEPIITGAPDGTLYIAALAHVYRSTNAGATWTQVANPTLGTAVLASDSSIAVDPGGRLYYTFDYPYAGNTAVCTSDDRGNTWNCNPAVAPGGTDRMWITAPATSAAYETTNEGLYQTTFLTSSDRGQTWTPQQFANEVTQPATGPLNAINAGSYILQPVNQNGYLYVYRFLPVQTVNPLADVQPTTIPGGVALPMASLGKDGSYWVVGEAPNSAGGREVVIGRSLNQGASFKQLPPIPQTTKGTATFTAIAAGSAGHVGVLYYYTVTSAADPTTLNATWNAVYAETYNANTVTPVWKVTTVDTAIHSGPICSTLGCSGDHRFSGDFISGYIDAHENSNLTWVKELSGGATVVRFIRIPHA